MSKEQTPKFLEHNTKGKYAQLENHKPIEGLRDGRWVKSCICLVEKPSKK